MEMYQTIFSVMFVVFSTLMGIVIGSFLNVIIYRIPEGRTVVKGHSMCMTCGHELGALDLVPVFSWLFLGGKCRYCKAPVSSRYIKIESFTGLCFLTVALTHIDYQVSPFWGINHIAIILFSHYCAILLCFAAFNSLMMIYHDVKKSYYGYTVYVGAFVIVIAILQMFLVPVSTVLINLLAALAIAACSIAILKILSLIFRKKYQMLDLWLDLPYTLFYGFFGRFLISTKFVIPVVAICYLLPRFILKGTKLDKYSLIVPTCGLLVVTVIGYILHII